MAAVVEYSIDNGDSWVEPGGDTWPSTTGLHLVRFDIGAAFSRRIMVRVTSTDALVWGIREILIKGTKEPQESSLT